MANNYAPTQSVRSVFKLEEQKRPFPPFFDTIYFPLLWLLLLLLWVSHIEAHLLGNYLQSVREHLNRFNCGKLQLKPLLVFCWF